MTTPSIARKEQPMTGHPDARHFSDEQLAAFLDGRLTSDEHRRALAHFAMCAACRREMSTARRLLAPPRARAWLPVGGVVTALAAALAFVMVARRAPDDTAIRATVRSPERATQPDRLAGFTVVSPQDRATVDSIIVFRWRAAGPDATYRVTLQDATGAVLWDTTVGDTAVGLPRAVVLPGGRQYFWSVDAQLAGGGSAKAGAHRFTTP